MREEWRNDFEPHGLAFDRHAPQAGKIPCAHLRRRCGRTKSALGQARTCPGEVGGRTARSGKGLSPRMVVEDPSPGLSAYGVRDLREICHPAAMRLDQFGIEQSQDDDINAVIITCCPNNRSNLLPPGRCNGHG